MQELREVGVQKKERHIQLSGGGGTLRESGGKTRSQVWARGSPIEGRQLVVLTLATVYVCVNTYI